MQKTRKMDKKSLKITPKRQKNILDFNRKKELKKQVKISKRQ